MSAYLIVRAEVAEPADEAEHAVEVPDGVLVLEEDLAHEPARVGLYLPTNGWCPPNA